MASVGHIAVGMAAARIYRRGQPTQFTLFTSMTIWSFLSLLPDGDAVGFSFGVAYSAPWGHRGATHSFVFAALLGLGIGLLARLSRLPALRTGVTAALVLASHPLLDCLTNGGLGCALFWPFNLHRYFAPWHPIPVAPIGRAFFSARGLSVALTELLYFTPLIAYAVWPRGGIRRGAR